MSSAAQALAAPSPSIRLQAALQAGTEADPADLDALLDRCAIEPDFFVRDMLTWALTRLPTELVVPRLVGELHGESAQARSQALHTLSKIGDPSTHDAVMQFIADPDDDVARPAWRAAVATTPAGGQTRVAEALLTQLGRGDREVQLSLSKTLVALGEDVIEPFLAARPNDENAQATLRLLHDPDTGFDVAQKAAQTEIARGNTRRAKG